jgi:hypothetical protein
MSDDVFVRHNYLRRQQVSAEVLNWDRGQVERDARWYRRLAPPGVYDIGTITVDMNQDLVLTVMLPHCVAKTPDGYPIEIPCCDVSSGLKAQFDASQFRGEELSIWIAVRETPPTEANTRHFYEYQLEFEPSECAGHILQVGRLLKRGNSFLRDNNFVPLCIRLDSAPEIISRVVILCGLAREFQDKMAQQRVFSPLAASELAASLASMSSMAVWSNQPGVFIAQACHALETIRVRLNFFNSRHGSGELSLRIAQVLRGIGELFAPNVANPTLCHLTEVFNQIERAMRAVVQFASTLLKAPSGRTNDVSLHQQ